MLPDAGANDGPLPNVEHGDHLHVVGYALLRDGPRASALAAIDRARAAGVTVSVDPSSWALLRVGAIPPVDLLLPNAAEAALLSDHPAGTLVTKLGPDGARWGDARVPAEPVEVVDTTGAGDAFAAGFLTARLGGAGPREALEAGCRLAARAVAQVGARPEYD
jgi:sugar/nucleoside kinase (ribokinase family)